MGGRGGWDELGDYVWVRGGPRIWGGPRAAREHEAKGTKLFPPDQCF